MKIRNLSLHWAVTHWRLHFYALGYREIKMTNYWLPANLVANKWWQTHNKYAVEEQKQIIQKLKIKNKRCSYFNRHSFHFTDVTHVMFFTNQIIIITTSNWSSGWSSVIFFILIYLYQGIQFHQNLLVIAEVFVL